MFENSVVDVQRNRIPNRRYLSLPLSLLFHLMAIGGALFAAVWHVELPTNSPAQNAAYVIDPKTPAPPGPEPSRPSQQPPSPRPNRPNVPTAPAVVPDTPNPSSTPEAVAEIASLDPGPFASGETGTPDFPGNGSSPFGDSNGVGDGNGTGPAEEAPRQVGAGVLSPKIIRQVPPRYPQAAVRSGVEGLVIVECIIDRNGSVKDARVLYSSNALFDDSAVDAVRQWKFSPGSYQGRAVATIFQLTVNFKIERR